MLMNELVKATGLTKKAVEYYTQQGLVEPRVLENGYRDYGESDVATLKKISVLRRLDIGIEDIKAVLFDASNHILQTLAVKKDLSLRRDAAKKALLDRLSGGKPYFEIDEELRALEGGSTIAQRLLGAFPGYYGRFVCLHFAQFLKEPIETEAQRVAYEAILSFLDDTPPLDLPEDVQAYLDEGTKHIGTEQIIAMVESVKNSVESPSEFLDKNKEALEEYLAFKQSEGYKSSPAYKSMELLKAFNRTSGYYDVFIPALKQLSASYAEYCRHLEAANERLLERYPEISEMDG